MKKNIGILTVPISEAGNNPLSNLTDIVYSLSNDTYLITGNDGYTFFKDDKRIHAYGINHEMGANTFTRILRHIYTQLRISSMLAKIAGKVDIWIFFIGGDSLVFPMLTAKLLRKTVVLAFAGSSVQTLESANDSLFKSLEILSKINCSLANRIIIYSENLINELDLEKYKNKILIAHHHFFDFDKLKIKKRFDARKNLVGYIGRLSEEKGVLNFVKAIPKVMEKENGIRFLVGGDGQLRDKIEEYLDVAGLNDKVKLTGWIPSEEFSTYLNELKLFVLPSYTEGLPYTILEAMACGTPVLATPVGAIPDVIKDGETGFIMEDNSSECIAENVIRALEHPDLERIVESAKVLVEREYTYEAAVKGYREILDNLGVEKCGQRKII
jgi:glycosyltransferase involved in cell wall biosynthesis